MEILAPEVKQIIAGYLDPTDLKSLRLVNQQFRAIAARPLFEILNFSGNEQTGWMKPSGKRQVFHHTSNGRKRTVQHAELPKAVEEVLPLAKYVKTFKFGPAYYREGLWQDYRLYIRSIVALIIP